jgi:hypothetical protein
MVMNSPVTLVRLGTLFIVIASLETIGCAEIGNNHRITSGTYLLTVNASDWQMDTCGVFQHEVQEEVEITGECPITGISGGIED